jgi:protocatechuate 3,4-dioxygenase beta subunit
LSKVCTTTLLIGGRNQPIVDSRLISDAAQRHPIRMTVSDAPSSTAQLPLTPSQIEGPYFRLGAPRRESLIEPGVTGERLMLRGQVLNPDGKAISNAILNFWMSDDEGNYDMLGHQLHGYTVSDAEGRYHMEMIEPACYEPRQAKHIHVKVQGVSRMLTTQLFLSDDEGRLRDRWYLPELEVKIEDALDGSKQGTFDFVIAQVNEKDNVTRASLDGRV